MPAIDILHEVYKSITDPRQSSKVLHKLPDIIILVFLGFAAGCDNMCAVAHWARLKKDIIKEHFELSNGIPSHDTLCRVFAMIDPEELGAGFRTFVHTLIRAEKSRESTEYAGDTIAIDGKTSRRSGGKGKRPLHVVSAFACEVRQVLAQEACEAKSNEMTAITRLLDKLDIKGSVITSDAMGTQVAIAKRIVELQGDYVLALKKNHPGMYDSTKQFFEDFLASPDHVPHTKCLLVEKGHGRIEQRYCYAFDRVDLLENNERWAGLKSFAVVVATREKGDEPITEQIRLYISSLPAEAKKLAKTIRSHWSIENRLHWCLDNIFKDDHMRLRTRNQSINAVIIKHLVLNIQRWFVWKNPQIRKECKTIPAFRMLINHDLRILLNQSVA